MRPARQAGIPASASPIFDVPNLKCNHPAGDVSSFPAKLNIRHSYANVTLVTVRDILYFIYLLLVRFA